MEQILDAFAYYGFTFFKFGAVVVIAVLIGGFARKAKDKKKTEAAE